MNSQSYIFLEYGLSDILKKFVIFEIFMAYTTSGFFLNPGNQTSHNMAMTVCGGNPILHDDTQNLKVVLIIADQFFHCKVVDIKLCWVFHFWICPVW